MKFHKTIGIAVHALRRNLMRAFLTMLGIIIGVAAVIAMMEIGQGSSSAIQRTIASMGANNLMIQPGAAASSGISFGGGSSLTLTPSDYEVIKKNCPSVRAVAPTVRGPRGQVVHGNKNWVPSSITGTTPEYIEVRDWTPLADGEMFSDKDVKGAARVCVIGQTIVRELFGTEDPLGQEIRIQNVPFKVVGVLRKKGANMMGMDQDDTILGPWTTMKRRVSNSVGSSSGGSGSSGASTASQTSSTGDLYPKGGAALYPPQTSGNSPLPIRFSNVDNIMAAARSTAAIPAAIKEITEAIRIRHRLTDGEDDDFNIRDMTEMSNTLASTTQMMTRLLLCVALISLIVGGVGIMNIMLVSVTERTREIGLRMAVGAKSRDILGQFLVEAVILCLAGGILGLGLGRGTSILVSNLLKWPTETSLAAVIASITVSAGVGIVFGFYPAWKASSLDPIDALRYE